MIEQIKKLKAQLEQKTQKNGTDSSLSPDGEITENGNDPNIMELQRDSSRQVNDLKFKLVKAEQEVTALEQNVSKRSSVSSLCYFTKVFTILTVFTFIHI
ncbi:hypothetical protein XENORESO_021991 [Xenotaenia resolanae]|uniref:Uncharacterized protein n=1 Tax=Xenotaenia resolanae TaxID=208358 RepID=A0ABV0X054_9TELE